MKLASGRNNYGQVLGIIMVKTSFPRIPGDIGNASTFKYPVRYKVIEDATPTRVVFEADKTLIPKFIEAAKELEKDGVRAITTSCGFLAIVSKYSWALAIVSSISCRNSAGEDLAVSSCKL